MRLNINLASRPYEDVRQFLVRWGTLALAMALLTGGLVFYAVSSWRQSRDVNRQIATLQQEMDRLDRERAAGIALLNRPENREIADQSAYLNQIIARKALSWTRIFEDLERMMPPRLHVVSIQPGLNKENQLQVQLVVAGDSRDRAVELVRRMEQSPTFRQAQLHNELLQQQSGAPDLIQFEITSLYVPSAPTAAPAEKPQASAEDGKNRPAMQAAKGGAR